MGDQRTRLHLHIPDPRARGVLCLRGSVASEESIHAEGETAAEWEWIDLSSGRRDGNKERGMHQFGGRCQSDFHALHAQSLLPFYTTRANR
jgi:hypothetical protein